MHLEYVDKNNLGLSVIQTSYKSWAQVNNQMSAKSEQPEPIPAKVQILLDTYPDILKVNFTKQPKHNIVHEIDTGTNPPCRARMRPILPNTPKYEEGKKAWLELEKLGIITKVKAGEPTTWSSPLHLALHKCLWWSATKMCTKKVD